MNARDFIDDIAQFEGCTTWLYCDSRGFPTIGIGNLVANAEAAVALPLATATGASATDEEKREAWTVVVSAYAKGHSAEFYRHLTTLRITEAFAFELCAQRIESDFLPGIRKLCHDFDRWPAPAQKAILDMAYNLGIHGLSYFVNLLSACQAQDWAAAAHECHRSTCRESRNLWTAQMFIDAAAATKGPNS